MTISVIIPTYKMGRYIGEALSSLSSQTYVNWEAIIVDDCGPEDGTTGQVSDFITRHPEHRIVFIRHEKNQQLGATRNTAIARAEGELIAFLDPDDVWMPDFLQVIASAFAADPQTSVVSTPVEAFYQTSKGEVVDPLLFKPWQLNCFPDSLVAGSFLQPSATVVRRSAMEEVGNFDPDPLVLEDIDLWIRLIRANHQFKFINTIHSRYRKHEGALTSDSNRIRLRYEGVIQKYPAFFIHAQSKMLRMMINKNERIKNQLKHPIRSLFAKLFGRNA